MYWTHDVHTAKFTQKNNFTRNLAHLRRSRRRTWHRHPSLSSSGSGKNSGRLLLLQLVRCRSVSLLLLLVVRCRELSLRELLLLSLELFDGLLAILDIHRDNYKTHTHSNNKLLDDAFSLHAVSRGFVRFKHGEKKEYCAKTDSR